MFFPIYLLLGTFYAIDPNSNSHAIFLTVWIGGTKNSLISGMKHVGGIVRNIFGVDLFGVRI